MTGWKPLCHPRERGCCAGRRPSGHGAAETRAAPGTAQKNGGVEGARLANWKGEHFPKPITCNVRSVTWQDAGSAWGGQLIGPLGGTLEQRAPETRATHVPRRRHVLGLGGLGYRRDQLGDSVPLDSCFTEMSPCADARPFSYPGRAGTSRFGHLHRAVCLKEK